MRMVARTELDRPVGLRMVAAEDVEEENDAVLTLLDKREMWLDERSTDEREWGGPDPGISALRNSVNRHQLGVGSQQLQDWLMHHLGENAQLYPTREQGVWMLGLDRVVTKEDQQLSRR